MLSIVFPSGINWFYELQAHSIEKDLTAAGVFTRAIAADEMEVAQHPQNSAVLIINLSECIISAKKNGKRQQLLEGLECFDRRILLNYDSIYSNWFSRQFADQSQIVNEIFDVCMKPQTRHFLRGLPYRWIAEAFTDIETHQLRDANPDPPLPWAIIGHATPSRAAFASAAQEVLGANGFVFLPPLRPYQQSTGLGNLELMRVLERCGLYIWNSHHEFPYHEGFRALHAIRSGAVPAKIDPLNWRHFRDIPWVFKSLSDLREKRDSVGLPQLFNEAQSFILRHGTIGVNLARAIRNSAAEVDTVGETL